jgi:hypothetical protein
MATVITETHTTPQPSPNRRRLRSAAAIMAGFVVLAVLSHLTDLLLSASGLYPPPGEALTDQWMYTLALAYRCAYAVLGCYLAARLAPRLPMRHALTLGAIGTVLAGVGVAALVAMPQQFGVLWYPVALLLTALPCAWLGGRLAAPRAA